MTDPARPVYSSCMSPSLKYKKNKFELVFAIETMEQLSCRLTKLITDMAIGINNYTTGVYFLKVVFTVRWYLQYTF